MGKRSQLSVLQLFIIGTSFLTISSCSIQKQLDKTAKADVLDTKALQTAHVGISIFDPSANIYLYNYQGDHYFVPASNTKLPTCYAAMKYLGDSLVGARYLTTAHSISIIPGGDPTFLLTEFKEQPLLNFLLKEKSREMFSINTSNWQENPLGSGWSWNDYQEYYMAERSVMPMFGNMIEFSGDKNNLKIIPKEIPEGLVFDSTAESGFVRSVQRARASNVFTLSGGGKSSSVFSLTFDTKNSIKNILQDILKIEINISDHHFANTNLWRKIKTQPTDSLLKPMMHRSDNFFAEQSLLMVSNEMLGYMNDEKVIDTLLKTDFKDLPQKPRWVDGSGLSRYNLFTPQDFIAILNKMKSEFGMERIKVILPTGGEGTISSYYKSDSEYIYGKTGTLSGVVAFSGFLYTRKGKLLIFSTLINNHRASATDVRRAIEKFLQSVRNKY